MAQIKRGTKPGTKHGQNKVKLLEFIKQTDPAKYGIIKSNSQKDKGPGK